MFEGRIGPRGAQTASARYHPHFRDDLHPPQAIDVAAVCFGSLGLRVPSLSWRGLWPLAVAACLVLVPVPCRGGEIRIDPRNLSPGLTFEIPIVIDRVEDLAGVKIVLQYDPGQLRYLSTARAQAAGQMLHVVNDKRPGTLIIVMAGATGIRGDNLALFTLTFQASADLAPGTEVALRIAESQLMSAQLKDIVHAAATRPLVVVDPGAEAAPNVATKGDRP